MKYLLSILFFFVIILTAVSYLLVIEKQKTNRLYTAIESFAEGNKHNSDSSVIEGVVKRLNISEIKKFFPEIQDELKAHGIKINTLVQYQKSQFEINATFEAKVKRIVTERDTSLITQFNDKWLKFSQTYNIGDTTAYSTIKMPVPIDQAISPRRKPFILWRFKPIVLEQKMWSENPYVDLTYNNVIQVVK